MSSTTYHHENLKQELIDAGLRIIAAEGIDNFSLRRLAAACNVSHAAPYKHFKNKEAILTAISEHVQSGFYASLLHDLDACADKSPHEKIVELGKSYVAFMLEHPDYLKFLFFNRTTRQLDSANILEDHHNWRPLDIFCGTAMNYLISIGARPEEYEYDIIAMWGMVHGLTMILSNNNWKPGIPYKDAVGKILSEKLKFD